VPPVPPLPKVHARSDSLKNRSESLKPRSDSLRPRSDSIKSRSDSLKGRSDSLKKKVQQPPLPIAVDHDKSNTIKLKNSNENVNTSPTQLTSDLTKELAEIEQDIKALEVERKRNSNFLPAPPSKPSGRKRGMVNQQEYIYRWASCVC
jgi:chromosome segregation ATPase